MIIRSARPDSHFSIFTNEVIRDSRLSYKARGILMELLSRPDNWRISAHALASSGIDGITAIMSGLKELRDLGYIVTRRRQDEKGHWTTESVVYDLPKSGFPSSDNPNSDNPPVIEEPIKKNRVRIKTGESENSPIQELMKIYFDNFVGDIQPARGQMAGQLQIVLKETTYEKLVPLVRFVAIEGQPVSKGTLMIAAKKLREPQQAPTAIPDRFNPTELDNPEAVPMPAGLKDKILKGIGKPIDGA